MTGDNNVKFINKAALRGSTSVCAALAALTVFSAPAFAQDDTPAVNTPAECADADADGVCDSDVGGAIVVTGSRIRTPNATSSLPITSIVGETFIAQGGNSIGDTLNDLPQLSSTFSQQNPGAGVGIAGLNLLDLRGLGTVRTLVLVNGRRHVGSDVLNNGVSVDTNTIPANLIERVDIVTGGNSAVYGSDAIAGVVNFVLKQNYDGVELRANAGIADAGFGANQTVSLIAGKNFAEERANITLSGEYSHADRVWASDIPWLRQNNNFVVVDVDPSANATNGIVNGSDGFPDRIFFNDIRLAQTSLNGIVPINQQPSLAACGTGIGSTAGAPGATGSGGGANGLPYNCNYIFNDAGRLVKQTGTFVSTGIVPVVIGGNGATGREGRTLSVLPFNERYIANLVSHFEVSPALDLFVEGKWARTKSQGNASGPSFFSGAANQFDGREKIRLDNPFLNPADRTTLTNLILASGCNPSFTVSCPNGGNLTAAQLTQIANGSYRFALGKVVLDAETRDELAIRTVKRVVGGARGTFWDDWNYEISANYGVMDQTVDKSGYFDKQRFALSIDAGRNPITGAIECRSKFDPAAAVSPTNNNTAAQNAKLAADIAACVPYNPFGSRFDNTAAVNYFNYFEHDTGHMDQLDISGFIGGNTGSFFNLWGGPISFVLGAEYRKENVRYTQEDFAGGGNTNALAGLSFDTGPFKVKEAFGEIQIPIVKDVFLLQELTLHGAARVSDYNSSAGTVWAYNYGADWAPIEDIRFRVNYGRAVRAPNLAETSGSIVPNFFNAFQDPCRAANIGQNPFRQANCTQALGAAVLNNPSFANQAAYSLPVLSGFNPNLDAETSDSWTIGGVLTPRWVPGLTVSVDYYDIKVNGVITSLTAQQIANGCYDQPTLQNVFCGQFQRFTGATGTGQFNEIQGQIQGNTLIQAPLNFAKRIRRGVDTQVSYRTAFSDLVSLNTNLIYTHVLKVSNYVNPLDATFEDQILQELGTPKNEFVWDADLRIGEFTLGYRGHYIGSMYLNAYEDFNGLDNGNTLNANPVNADYADVQKYPAVMYHDVRLQWDLKDLTGVGKSFQLYVGADNVLDKRPPFSLTGIGAGSVIYDFRGRTFYAGIRAGF